MEFPSGKLRPCLPILDKCSSERKTLAYFVTATITTVNSFRVRVPGAFAIKPFTAVTHASTQKAGEFVTVSHFHLSLMSALLGTILVPKY